jgi:urea transport system permease protein
VSGALVTLDLGVISPAMFGVVPSIEMVIWVALGGRNSLLGAIAGTLVVNFGKDWVSSAFPDLWLYVVGAVFVLVVTVAPQGLTGLLERIGRSRIPAAAPAPPAIAE